jgi:hypothetical protein
MSGQVAISGWCKVSNNHVWVNGRLVFESPGSPDFGEFSKAAFKSLEQAYLKFYKMDNLSKLGFLCAEYLLKHSSIAEKYAPEDVGIILSNAASCIDTDIEHQKTIADCNNYFPSPSVFVYTLPNIVIGEISIKHKIQGENTFFIFEQFQPDFLANYVQGLFMDGRLKACLTGWVDLSPGASNFNAVFYLAEMSGKEGTQPFNSETLKNLYNQ